VVHIRELRGFGFVQFLEAGDAAEAQYNMDHQLIGGREITVVFAEENRKKPQEMRLKDHTRYLNLCEKTALASFAVSIRNDMIVSFG
jgi:hypothetical protein